MPRKDERPPLQLCGDPHPCSYAETQATLRVSALAAVKKIDLGRASGDQLDRIMREVSTLSRLQHPNGEPIDVPIDQRLPSEEASQI